MPPAITPGSQVRSAATAVGTERGRNFSDPHPQQGCLHHHFGRKLHTCRSQSHALICVLAESSKTAVKISHSAAEQHSAHSGKNGISNVPVESGHRALLNASLEAVAHDQV